MLSIVWRSVADYGYNRNPLNELCENDPPAVDDLDDWDSVHELSEEPPSSIGIENTPVMISSNSARSFMISSSVSIDSITSSIPAKAK
jgi:hypothetical protein